MAFAQIAKITRPDVRSTIKRTSVFQVLDDASDRPVVWVWAPAGAGKTILVAGFLESRVIPSLWYRLDAGDAEPATFFYYLGLAAKSTNPGCYTALPLLTPEYALGMDTFAKRYFENLFISLRCMTPPGHLVLDDYQQVSETAALHNILAAALDVMPPGINVTIISRRPPPSSFARLRSNKRLAIVDWESIKFSRREAAELIEGVLGPSPGTQRQRRSGQKQAKTTGESRARENHGVITDRLHQVTDGWAAGLVLLTERFKSDKTSLCRLTTSNTREEIVAYLAEEVWSAVEKNTRDFLIRTCLLPQMTPHTAAAISGNKYAGRILAGLSHRNCFTEKRLLHPLVYQYHP